MQEAHPRLGGDAGRSDADRGRSSADTSVRVQGPRLRRRPCRNLLVPPPLRERREQLKQQVWMQSLEQLAERLEHRPDQRAAPDLEIDIPEEGDFEYEFDVKVRPSFDLPTYKGTQDRASDARSRPTPRSTREYLNKYLEQYATLRPGRRGRGPQRLHHGRRTFSHKGTQVNEYSAETFRVRPTLQFPDARTGRGWTGCWSVPRKGTPRKRSSRFRAKPRTSTCGASRSRPSSTCCPSSGPRSRPLTATSSPASAPIRKTPSARRSGRPSSSG